ncbi:MAG: hypothetical protein P4M14_10155 [Gammaproteobacteria bacterium]|nr:hypothetical protein [Gammaproteobacteria bacterium]
MDKDRKRYLKKLGSKLVKERSEQLQKIMQESNPADVSDSQWAKNYKEINSLQKKYNNNRSEVYTKDSEGLDFIAHAIEMNLSKEYIPIQTYYLHCKKNAGLLFL